MSKEEAYAASSEPAMGEPSQQKGFLGTINKWRRKMDAFNDSLTDTKLGKYFCLRERKTTVSQELWAGAVCFLTVCYIIPVNSGILSDSGGTCDPPVHCNAERYAMIGSDCKFDDPITNPEWAQCIFELKQNLIAATCIAAMIGTLIMALVANMPVAIAPAMGVNAFFTYNVVGFMGTGRIPYTWALAAAFVEGLIFIALSVSGVRGRFVELIPKSLMFATAAGIGLFLAFIGLQKSEGLGLITYDGATLVTIGGCPDQDRSHMYTLDPNAAYWHDLCWNAWRGNVTASYLDCGTCGKAYDYFVNQQGLTPPINLVYECSNDIYDFGSTTGGTIMFGLPPRSANYECANRGKMRSATLWLGIMGGMIMVLCMIKDIKVSILIGILFVTFISWIPTSSNAATYFTEHSSIPGGEERYQYFLKGATTPNVSKTGGKLYFPGLSHGDTWAALVTFLYLDFLDATSTMYAMASLINEKIPGYLSETGTWPGQMLAMCTDGLSITVGSTLGTSPLTVFAESGVGIKAGGRTGICSFVIAMGFGVSMFLSPIFASIPPYATGPAIVFVGVLMFDHVRFINWRDIYTAVPAFLTIILMPLTYSIAYGIIAGIMTQIFLWTFCFGMEVIEVLIFKKKSMRQVWLYWTSSWYVAFHKEQVLIDELKGYKKVDHGMSDDQFTGFEEVEVKLGKANLNLSMKNAELESDPSEEAAPTMPTVEEGKV